MDIKLISLQMATAINILMLTNRNKKKEIISMFLLQ